MKRKIGKVLWIVVLLVIGKDGYGITFTEDFSTNNKIDTTNTSAVVNTNLKRTTLSNTQELVFEDISSQVVGFSTDTVQAVGYNGSYWLIGGTNGKLNKYDGTTFTDLTSSLNFGAGAAGILAIAWNGSYWLIGGTGEGVMKLFRYDGTIFTDVRTNAISAGFNTTIRAIKANGTDALIGGDGAQLVKYNGTTFTNLSSSLVGFTTNDVTSLGWNGSYWLIGGAGAGGRLNRYDGTTFTDLTAFSGNVRGIGWNGTYWLINAGVWQTSPTLSKYDGATFTDITSSLVGFSTHVNSGTWNSDYNYWLIGGGGGTTAFNRYDGNSFTNIASSLTNVSSSTVINSIWAGNMWFIYGADTTRSLNKGIHLYASSNVLQSRKLNDISENIISGTLTASVTLNGGSISYELSADGGAHWETVTAGTSHTFKYPGKDLRYKATTTPPTNRKLTPILTQVSISYKTEAKKIKSGEKGEVLSNDDIETKILISAEAIPKTLTYSIERVAIPSLGTSGPKDIVLSYNFEAREPDTNKVISNLEGVIEIIIHYRSSDGVKVYDTNGKELIKLSETKEKLGLGFYNGRYWVPVSSEVTVNNNDVYVKSRVSHLSEYGIIRKVSSSIDVNVSPNPFTPKAGQYNIVNFTFQNDNNESVELRIWDITAGLAKTIIGNGTSSISWDGKNEYGEYVEGGVYIYQLKVGNNRAGRGTIVVAY